MTFRGKKGYECCRMIFTTFDELREHLQDRVQDPSEVKHYEINLEDVEI